MVMWRLLVTAVLLYITFDFADLMMPGVMNFEPDQSADAMYAPNVRGDAPLAIVPAIPPRGIALVLDEGSSLGRPVRPVARHSVRRIAGRRTFVSESRPASLEDH
jgi:hypothetical protein